MSGDTSGFLPAFEFNYGLIPDGHFHIIAPVAFDSPSGGPTQFGPGDVELGWACDVRSWHFCDVWPHLNEGCLRQLTGHVATPTVRAGFDPKQPSRMRIHCDAAIASLLHTTSDTLPSGRRNILVGPGALQYAPVAQRSVINADCIN
jgi:hypothetical protein